MKKNNNLLILTKLQLLTADCLDLTMSQFVTKESLHKERDRLIKEIKNHASKLSFSDGTR